MRFTVTTLVLLSLSTASCGHMNGSRESVATVQGAQGEITRRALEQRIHELVNEARRERGLSTLGWSAEIRPIARGHSGHMARHGYFAHRSPNGDEVDDRYRRGGFECAVSLGRGRYLTGGENLYSSHVVRYWRTRPGHSAVPHQRHSLDTLARAAVDGWLESRAHRDNLLNRHWRNEAIGVHIAADGRVWVTQNFC